ncbi:gluconate 5-dehydrogenase [Yersinia thracica]
MRDDFTASLRSACFHRCGHFVNNLILKDLFIYPK